MISIVIPVFNEEAVLPELRQRLEKAANGWGDEYEVIFVDDGSTDRTLEILRAYHAENPRLKVLSFARNFGHQIAVSAGLQFTSGNVVAVIDGDLQDPPEVLGRFFEKWREGYQVVYAIRTQRKEGFLLRFCYAVFYRILARLSDIHIPLDSGDFCVMDRRVVDVLNQMPERLRFVRGLRSWVGFRQVGLTYERDARVGGTSKYTFKKLVRLALDGILSFSYFPLRIASYLGFLVALVAFCGGIGVIIAKIWHPGVFMRGTTATRLIILFLGGVQLFTIGILGEYLGRVLDEVKRRPLFVAKERLGLSD